MKTELINTVSVGNTLGEGVTWDSRNQTLWWTDIQEKRLYRLQWPSQSIRIFELPDRLASFGFTSDEDRLITAFADGFYLFSPESGERELVSLIEADNPATRMNEGRLDRQGRFWAGSMVERPSAGAVTEGALYCVDAGRVTRQLEGVGISNGPAFPSDGKTMFFADSPTGLIRQYDLDTSDGRVSYGLDFARSLAGAVPYGALMVGDGYYWSAQWGCGQVVRYARDGSVDLVVESPDPQVSCV